MFAVKDKRRQGKQQPAKSPLPPIPPPLPAPISTIPTIPLYPYPQLTVGPPAPYILYCPLGPISIPQQLFPPPPPLPTSFPQPQPRRSTSSPITKPKTPSSTPGLARKSRKKSTDSKPPQNPSTSQVHNGNGKPLQEIQGDVVEPVADQALSDMISSKFDSVITSIDKEVFSGDLEDLEIRDEAQPGLRGGWVSTSREVSRRADKAISSAVTSTNYFSKVNLYANSKLPPNLPPLTL